MPIWPEVPEEKIEAEVAREMKIPRMELPKNGFYPHVKESDLEDLENRDRKVILSMSVLEQKIDFLLRWFELHNYHVRMIEAEQIRSASKQSELNTNWKVIRWIGIVAGAGIVAALCQGAIRWLMNQ